MADLVRELQALQYGAGLAKSFAEIGAALGESKRRERANRLMEELRGVVESTHDPLGIYTQPKAASIVGELSSFKEGQAAYGGFTSLLGLSKTVEDIQRSRRFTLGQGQTEFRTEPGGGATEIAHGYPPREDVTKYDWIDASPDIQALLPPLEKKAPGGRVHEYKYQVKYNLSDKQVEYDPTTGIPLYRTVTVASGQPRVDRGGGTVEDIRHRVKYDHVRADGSIQSTEIKNVDPNRVLSEANNAMKNVKDTVGGYIADPTLVKKFAIALGISAADLTAGKFFDLVESGVINEENMSSKLNLAQFSPEIRSHIVEYIQLANGISRIKQEQSAPIQPNTGPAPAKSGSQPTSAGSQPSTTRKSLLTPRR